MVDQIILDASNVKSLMDGFVLITKMEELQFVKNQRFLSSVEMEYGNHQIKNNATIKEELVALLTVQSDLAMCAQEYFLSAKDVEMELLKGIKTAIVHLDAHQHANMLYATMDSYNPEKFVIMEVETEMVAVQNANWKYFTLVRDSQIWENHQHAEKFINVEMESSNPSTLNNVIMVTRQDASIVS